MKIEQCFNIFKQQALSKGDSKQFFGHIQVNGKSSLIRQKAEFQNRCLRKRGMPNFPKNELFLPPDTHTYVSVSGG